MTEQDIRDAAITIADNCSRYYTVTEGRIEDSRIEKLREHLRAQIESAEESHGSLPTEDRYFRHGLAYAYREALRLLEKI